MPGERTKGGRSRTCGSEGSEARQNGEGLACKTGRDNGLDCAFVCLVGGAKGGEE